MEVIGLWRYPVKSLQGELIDAASVEADGVAGDRRWSPRPAHRTDPDCAPSPRVPRRLRDLRRRRTGDHPPGRQHRRRSGKANRPPALGMACGPRVARLVVGR